MGKIKYLQCVGCKRKYNTYEVDYICPLFVPESIPQPKLAQILIYGADVIKVKGGYDRAFELSLKASEEKGWYSRNTGYNPWLLEGKKTAALELCEQLRWDVPDMVLVPVGDGCIISGMWKGFLDLKRLGFIDRLPKMVGVQAEGSNALTTAFKEGKDFVEKIVPHTIADSISVAMPADYVKALRAVRESKGYFATVTDDEILNAMKELARTTGVFAEPSGAATFAHLRTYANELQGVKSVVIMVTGNGLKNVESGFLAVKK
jgi:threonine synthase